MWFILFVALSSSSVLEMDVEKTYQQSRSGGALQKAREFGAQVEAGKLAERTDKALDLIVMKAVKELKNKGYVFDADIIKAEWKQHKGFLSRLSATRDLGDHEAIKWLLATHDKIHEILGDAICRSLRVHDMWVMAYAIPMVFNCANESQLTVSMEEYGKHFIPFLGIVGYWVSWGVCIAMTEVPMVCGVLGEAVEELIIRFIAPPLSDKFYPRACNETLA